MCLAIPADVDLCDMTKVGEELSKPLLGRCPLCLRIHWSHAVWEGLLCRSPSVHSGCKCSQRTHLEQNMLSPALPSPCTCMHGRGHVFVCGQTSNRQQASLPWGLVCPCHSLVGCLLKETGQQAKLGTRSNGKKDH